MGTRWRPWLGSGIVLLVCLTVGPVGSTDEGSDVTPSPAWDWAFRWNDYGLKEIPCSAEPCPFPSPYPPDAPLWMSPEDWEDRIRGMVAFDLSFGPVLDADNPVRVFVPEASAGTVEVWWHRTGEAGWRVGETFRVEDRVLLAPPPAGMEGEATYQVVVRTRNGVRWAVGPARTVWVGSMGTSQGSALIPQGFAPGPQGLAPMEASPSEAVQWVPASFMGGEDIRSQSLRVHTDEFGLGPGDIPIRIICDYERTANTHCATSWYLFTMCNVRIVETRSGTHSICGQGQHVEEKFISFYRPFVFIGSGSDKSTETRQDIFYYNGNIISNLIWQRELMEQSNAWGKWKIPLPPQEGLRLKYFELEGALDALIGGTHARDALPIPFFSVPSPEILGLGWFFSYPAESGMITCEIGSIGSGGYARSAYTQVWAWSARWRGDGSGFSPGEEVMLSLNANALPIAERSAFLNCSYPPFNGYEHEMIGNSNSSGARVSVSGIEFLVGYVCEGGKTVSLQVEPARLAPRDPRRRGNDTATLTVTVRRCGGEPARGETVHFRLEREEGSGGHRHPAPQASPHAGALGTLDPETCVTDDNGRCRVTYTAPEAAGLIRITAEGDGARSDPQTVTVRLEGLVPLPAYPGLELIGETDTHPFNHYGTPRTVGALFRVGEMWSQIYPNDRVGINDMSLEWGGLFDFRSTWASPHDYHRTGENVDVRTVDKTEKQLSDLRKIIRRQECTIYEHADPPHWHLTCR